MNNGDKRSVATDALETLGTVITEREKRDAIHLAVNPTRAKEKFAPGQAVGVDGTSNNPVGIVDPFLTQEVQVGEWFWLVVYPRQITSLRHVWSHPAFPNAPEAPSKSDSEAWLRNFCRNNDMIRYESLIEAAELDFKKPLVEDEYSSYIEMRDDYLCSYGVTAHCNLSHEFWEHLENVVGKKFETRPNYFSCSC